MANRSATEILDFFDEETNAAYYVVADQDTNSCAVIDSILDFDFSSGRISTRTADSLMSEIHFRGYKVEWVLETHVHADHLSAAPYIAREMGGKIAIGSKIDEVQRVFGKIFNAGTDFQMDGSQFDALFEDGDEFSIGNIPVRVMHTPGHTPACVTYLIEDAAFIGDTLFMPDFGTGACGLSRWFGKRSLLVNSKDPCASGRHPPVSLP